MINEEKKYLISQVRRLKGKAIFKFIAILFLEFLLMIFAFNVFMDANIFWKLAICCVFIKIYLSCTRDMLCSIDSKDGLIEVYDNLSCTEKEDIDKTALTLKEKIEEANNEERIDHKKLIGLHQKLLVIIILQRFHIRKKIKELKD